MKQAATSGLRTACPPTRHAGRPRSSKRVQVTGAAAGVLVCWYELGTGGVSPVGNAHAGQSWARHAAPTRVVTGCRPRSQRGPSVTGGCAVCLPSHTSPRTWGTTPSPRTGTRSRVLLPETKTAELLSPPRGGGPGRRRDRRGPNQGVCPRTPTSCPPGTRPDARNELRVTVQSKRVFSLTGTRSRDRCPEGGAGGSRWGRMEGVPLGNENFAGTCPSCWPAWRRPRAQRREWRELSLSRFP